MVDFLGSLTDAKFRVNFGIGPDSSRQPSGFDARLPVIGDGEGWFEAVNWVEAAREARGRYVMMTLGACYAAQAVGAWRALQLLNPMPCKLVAVEPEPENCQWIRRHMRDNGIDPDDHWLVPLALSDTNNPVLFPVGSPGTGAQNCVATNEATSREIYAREILASGRVEDALRNLLIHNTTGLTKDLVPGHNFMAEIKLVGAVTLEDLLGPFERVDYLEADMQQSEILVIPPFIDLLKRKVHRIHIGTHAQGSTTWRCIGSSSNRAGRSCSATSRMGRIRSELGTFATNDGVLTVLNPDLRRSG